jgi:hypothetical protein
MVPFRAVEKSDQRAGINDRRRHGQNPKDAADSKQDRLFWN